MAKDLRTTYNRIADDFAADHEFDSWAHTFLDAFVSKLASPGSMLDLGCGPGWELKRLRRPGLAQTGFDLSERLLAIARANNPEATLVQGDMRRLPFADATYDGVVAKASLLHLPKAEVPSVLAEIHRVLKPDGVVYVALKKRGDDQSEETTVREDDYGYAYERFFSYWTMPELTAVLEGTGFALLQERERVSSSGRTTWLNVLAQRR